MKNCKHLMLLIALLPVAGLRNASAVPAYPKPTVITQSDGMQITIRIYGDEYHHYILSEEGYTLTGGPDGDYYYARLAADGTLEATSVKAKPLALLNGGERAKVTGLPKGIRPTAISPLKLVRRASAPQPAAAKAPVNGNQAPGRITSTATTGRRKWPIILVQFSDTKFVISNPKQSISNLLNQDGYSVNGSTGSAWNYYYENSNGQFNPEFVVYGPYTASKSASYYAGSGGTENVRELVVEVCRLADKDIDFSDFNENGVIKDVILFYAGHNQAEGASNTIWPHCSSVGGNYYFDGVRLDGYGCFSELRGGQGRTITNIGTFCHEFGHILGWPDFYDTDYSGALGTDIYSLMCRGSYNNQSRTPPALNILERWMMGWATPEELIASGYYTLDPVTEDAGYLIPSGTQNEYFLAEYRGKGNNKWDNPEHIGGSGLMVYHVDNTSPYYYQWVYYASPNDDPDHECMKLVHSVPANSYPTSSDIYPPAYTFFPGSRNITRLSGTTNREYKSWSNRAPAVEFESIAVSNGTVQLAVKGEGALKPDIGFTATAGQYGALLTWTDAESESWDVSWKATNASDATAQTKAVRVPNAYLEGLEPDTSYEVTITPTPNGSDKAQTFTFTTEAPGDGLLRIVLPKTELLSTAPIAFDIADYGGAFDKLEWYIDGAPSTSAYRTLMAGEHTVMAVITAADGSKEYLIKYITVK